MNKTLLNYRSLFPTLNKKVQLSSCSQSALASPVINSMETYKASLLNEGMDWISWMEEVNEAKANFAKLINADEDEIAVLSSVSESISSVLSSFPSNHMKKKIVTTELDFPCIGHALQTNKDRLGVQIHYIPSDNNYTINLNKYKEEINTETLLTCISHVSYYNGFKQDINEISKIAHDNDSYLFVDAYQSIGNIHIDVKEMDVDFLAAGAQKYMLGIPGIAFLYIKKDLSNNLRPKITGWFSQEDPFSFDVKNHKYAEGTRRFDIGTPPVINAYVANAALKLLLEIGTKQIQSYLESLSDFTITYAEEKGLKVVSPKDSKQKGATTAIYFENASQIEQQMKQEGFIVSARKDVIRIAPHFYNTKEDIKQAINTLTSL